MPGPYYLQVDTTALKVLLARTSGPFGSPKLAGVLGQSVRKWGVMLQTRARHNVSGHPVLYNGQAFVVRVRTGTLQNSIELQWPYTTAFQARVFVNGTHMNPGEILQAGMSRPRPVSDYAWAIEKGHDAIDLKKSMMGKIVPFFGQRQERIRGPYAAGGLKPVDAKDTDYGSAWRSASLDAKLQAKGKGPMSFTKRGGHPAYKGSGAGTYFISFRRVGKTGWIIPKAAPRPFMRAALEGTADAGRRMVVRDVKAALLDGIR
jgi:hypothetical protein